jgi:hypothetical protein
MPANSLILPEPGAAVTLSGWVNDSAGDGSILYGMTLDAAGAQYSFRNDTSAGITIQQCDFIGSPTDESVRITSANTQIVGCRFAGSPGHHDVKVFTNGGGSVKDCSFESTPLEDHIQCENQLATLIEFNRFAVKSGEDAIDTKPGGAVTIRGHDFTLAGFNNEAILSKNSTNADIITGNRFGPNCFFSVGAGDAVVALASISGNYFSYKSVLRLRDSLDLTITDNDFNGAEVQLGTVTVGDFPVNAQFTANRFRDLTINISNVNSTTATSGNTYTGTTTGTFPSGNN